MITLACCTILCRPRSLAKLCFKPARVAPLKYQIFYQLKVVTTEQRTFQYPATFGSSSTSADEADDDDGSDTEEGTEVDIEALEEDELFVQNLGRNQETVGRTGDDYEKEESDGPSDSPQLKHKVTNDSNSGDDDCEEGDEDNEDEAGETASSSRS